MPATSSSLNNANQVNLECINALMRLVDDEPDRTLRRSFRERLERELVSAENFREWLKASRVTTFSIASRRKPVRQRKLLDIIEREYRAERERRNIAQRHPDETKWSSSQSSPPSVQAPDDAYLFSLSLTLDNRHPSPCMNLRQYSMQNAITMTSMEIIPINRV